MQSPVRSLGRVGAIFALVALLLGCGHTDRISMSHRRTLGGASRIVVLPITIPQQPEGTTAPAEDGRSLASLYATELLRSYEILDYDRFERELTSLGVELDSVLVNGTGEELRERIGIDGVLVSEVYSWEPGKKGILFLAKDGRIGFQARLVDIRTGSVVWSVNRVRKTRPQDPLSVGLAGIFADIVEVMPRNLNPY